ncbi:hypothetical protein MMC34_008382 [Xylographa carneopallida]|nr:hypothetical protein [Xylographa carneopallida]
MSVVCVRAGLLTGPALRRGGVAQSALSAACAVEVAWLAALPDNAVDPLHTDAFVTSDCQLLGRNGSQDTATTLFGLDVRTGEIEWLLPSTAASDNTSTYNNAYPDVIPSARDDRFYSSRARLLPDGFCLQLLAFARATRAVKELWSAEWCYPGGDADQSLARVLVFSFPARDREVLFVADSHVEGDTHNRTWRTVDGDSGRVLQLQTGLPTPSLLYRAEADDGTRYIVSIVQLDDGRLADPSLLELHPNGTWALLATSSWNSTGGGSTLEPLLDPFDADVHLNLTLMAFGAHQGPAFVGFDLRTGTVSWSGAGQGLLDCHWCESVGCAGCDQVALYALHPLHKSWLTVTSTAYIASNSSYYVAHGIVDSDTGGLVAMSAVYGPFVSDAADPQWDMFAWELVDGDKFVFSSGAWLRGRRDLTWYAFDAFSLTLLAKGPWPAPFGPVQFPFVAFTSANNSSASMVSLVAEGLTGLLVPAVGARGAAMHGRDESGPWVRQLRQTSE